MSHVHSSCAHNPTIEQSLLCCIPATSGHSRETEKMAIIDRSPLFTGSLHLIVFSGGILSGCMKQVTAIDRWPLRQVWLYFQSCLHGSCSVMSPEQIGSKTLLQTSLYHFRNTGRSKILLYTPYISQGFYFREFRESGAIHKFNNTQKYLPPIRPDAWRRLVYAILVVQYSVHVQGRISNFCLLKMSDMILISPSTALLLDRESNHLRKCLEVPIREKLDSQNIWRIQYSVWPTGWYV